MDDEIEAMCQHGWHIALDGLSDYRIHGSAIHATYGEVWCAHRNARKLVERLLIDARQRDKQLDAYCDL